jgi:hypothetical protein
MCFKYIAQTDPVLLFFESMSSVLQFFALHPSDLRSVTATDDAIRAGQERSISGCRGRLSGSRSTRAPARDIPLAVVEPSSPTFVNRARTPANKLLQNGLCRRAVASMMILARSVCRHSDRLFNGRLL